MKNKAKVRPKSAHLVSTDDVRNIGGKEMILNRMVNHYKAIMNVKAKVVCDGAKFFVKSNNLNTKDSKIELLFINKL